MKADNTHMEPIVMPHCSFVQKLLAARIRTTLGCELSTCGDSILSAFVHPRVWYMCMYADIDGFHRSFYYGNCLLQLIGQYPHNVTFMACNGCYEIQCLHSNLHAIIHALRFDS